MGVIKISFLPLIFWDWEVFCLKDEDATLGGTYMRISRSVVYFSCQYYNSLA